MTLSPEGLRLLKKMKSDWSDRARSEAAYFIATINSTDPQDFEESGRRDVYYVFRWLEHLLHADETVLDIGCGIGRMDQWVAPRVKQLIGIDVAPEMVAKARERLAHLGNTRFVEGDGISLAPIATGSVGVVFSHIVFQHLPREVVQSYFHEVYRVLRPGGSFVFQVPEAASLVPIEPGPDDTFELRFYTEDALRAAVEGVGFAWQSAARFRVAVPGGRFNQLRTHVVRP